MSTMLYTQRKRRHVLVCVFAQACMCVVGRERERENLGKEEILLSFNQKKKKIDGVPHIE